MSTKHTDVGKEQGTPPRDAPALYTADTVPGFFPDLTRYQAEADQASVNQGHQSWKNDPAQVAKALTVQFFQ